MNIPLYDEYTVIKTFFHPEEAWNWVRKELSCGTAVEGNVREVNFTWQAYVIYKDEND